MPCSACAAQLFTWEQPVGLCRTHGLAGHERHDGVSVLRTDGSIEQEPAYRTDRVRSLMVLGSINPPIPERGISVRWVRPVLAPTEDDLRTLVAEHQALTPAMRGPRDITLNVPKVDPQTREAVGREDRQFRIVP